MLLIIGRLHVKPEQVAQFQAFARGIIEEERRVPGCLGFDILQDVTHADQFIMMERWRDQAALDAHLNTDAYKRNSAGMDSFLAAEAEWDEYTV